MFKGQCLLWEPGAPFGNFNFEDPSHAEEPIKNTEGKEKTEKA